MVLQIRVLQKRLNELSVDILALCQIRLPNTLQTGRLHHFEVEHHRTNSVFHSHLRLDREVNFQMVVDL